MLLRPRHGSRRTQWRTLLAAVLLVVLALPVAVTGATSPASAAVAGPVIVAGIDAEDGGPGGHGPITVYQTITSNLLAQVTNGATGILVIGGGKDPSDDVTTFWNTIGTALGRTVTHVNGAANISAQSFAGFALIVVSSSEFETSSGGLTDAESDALAGRDVGIANHVNGGGALLVFTQNELSQPYAFLASLGSITADHIMTGSDSDIDVTAEGAAAGLSDDLDVCCWHHQYTSYPSFLQPLAFYAGSTEVAALGGSSVVLPSGLTLTPETQTVTVGQSCSVTATVLRSGQPVPNQMVTFLVTAGPHAGATATVATDASGNAVFSYPTSAAGTDTISATTTIGADVLTATGTCTVTAPAPTAPAAPAAPVLAVPTFTG